MPVIQNHTDSDNNARLFAEKINRLFSNQRLGNIGTLVNAFILVLIQWKQVNHLVLYIWFGFVFSIISGRSLLARQFNRRDIRFDQAVIWRNLCLSVIFASGFAWGMAGIFLFPGQSIAHQMFTAFTIGGMVAGASAVFSAFRSSFFAFSLPAMLPVIINSVLFQDGVHFGMSVMMILFLLLMSATSLRNNRVIEAAIKLGFEKQGLADYLAHARDRAESINHKLQSEINQRRRIEVELEKHQRQLESEVENRTAELQDRNAELQHEINERVRIEAALRESEERYRLLIENTIVGIVLIKDQKIVFANRFVAMLSGYSQDEILGRSFIDFIHPEDREFAITNYVRRLKGEIFTDTYSIRMQSKSSEVHWLDVSAVRLHYEGMPSILVYMRDISKQHKLESQLFQSEKMASIGQLAAGVAHEINNPVGFVNSNLHTLAEYQNDIKGLIEFYRQSLEDVKNTLAGADNDLILEKIEAIQCREADIDLGYILEDCPVLINESRDGMERIKKIVMDLKDFAHPGEEGLQMIDINQSIESTLNIVWNELKYNAEIIKNFEQIPDIEGYPQQLNQVFMNLLVNAAQAITGKGQIRIQTRGIESSVEIEISDTGCGIPQENLGKIFDPFFTTKPVGKGTGLGLNVSYNIIKKHNGTLKATSKVGKGTVFTIQLPVQTDRCALGHDA